MAVVFRTSYLFFGILLLLQATIWFIVLPTYRSTDEPTWISNGIKFEQALARHDWAKTRLTTRPGVSVMWIVALATRPVISPHDLLWASPDDLTIRSGVISAARVGVISTLVVCNLLVLFFLQQLVGRKTAFSAALLLGLHPIFLESNYLAWTDSFLVYGLILSWLAFHIYLKKQSRWWVVATGAFFGFAILTKVIAWILPALFLANTKHWPAIRVIGEIIIIGLLIFYALYPAAWLQPQLILDRTSELTTSYTSPYAVIAEQPSWHYPLFIFLLDPVLLVLVILSLYVLWRLKNREAPLTYTSYLVAGLYLAAIYATSFFKDTGLFTIRSDRYVAPVIPFLIIGVVYSWYAIQERLKLQHFYLVEAGIGILSLVYLLRVV